MSETKSGPFTRKKLTPFLAHEMIYDYANGTLEADRRSALEEFMKTDHESQTLLANIQLARQHTEALSGLQVDAEILSQLIEAESAISLGKKYSSWREWPETLRWSVTAIVMSAVVAGGVAVVPWARLTASRKAPAGPESVEIAQIPQAQVPDDAEAVAANEEGSGDEAPDDEGSGDDVADTGSGDSGDDEGAPSSVAAAAASAATKATATPPPASAGVAAHDPAKDLKPPADHVAGLAPAPHKSLTPEMLVRNLPVSFVTVTLPKIPWPPKPSPPTSTPVQVAIQVAASPTPSPSSNASANIAMSVTQDSHDRGDAKARGFVYRAFMTLSDLDDVSPKIKSEIVALGGEKAGEVELGWKRGQGRYFHFAIPESNEKKILERLQVYGPVRISKDPHPRVMPQGQVRFILWVESPGGSTNGAGAGAEAGADAGSETSSDSNQ